MFNVRWLQFWVASSVEPLAEGLGSCSSFD